MRARDSDLGIPWASAAGDEIAERGRLVLVTEAVATLAQRGEPVTVNAIAQEVGLDQSGASRLVNQAAEAGFVTLAPAPDDGRRRHAAMTPAGHQLLERAHAWQERVFATLTDTWTERQRRDFHSAVTSLIERSRGWEG